MEDSEAKKKPSSKTSTSSGILEQLDEANTIRHNGFSKGMMMDYLLSLQDSKVEERAFVVYTGLQGAREFDEATRQMHIESEIYHIAPAYNTWGSTYTAGIPGHMIEAVKTFLDKLE